MITSRSSSMGRSSYGGGKTKQVVVASQARKYKKMMCTVDKLRGESGGKGARGTFLRRIN